MVVGIILMIFGRNIAAFLRGETLNRDDPNLSPGSSTGGDGGRHHSR